LSNAKSWFDGAVVNINTASISTTFTYDPNGNQLTGNGCTTT
jgi:hypothetical protein